MSNTVILAITSLFLALMWYLEIRSTRSLKKELREERDRKFEEQIRIRYDRHYKFINIENAGDNDTLNRTAEKYHEEGYDLDREKSTDRLLVFVKSEEVKEE
jgi:hypothetical protein